MTECLEHRTADSALAKGTAPCKCCEEISELYLRALVDSYSVAVAVLDEIGTILYVNRPWREFAILHGYRADYYAIGHNYLEARRQATDASVEQSASLAANVDQVLLGRETDFQEEYLSLNSIPRRWLRIHAARFDLPRAVRVLLTHEDVTESRRTAQARLEQAEHLRQLLNVVHVLPWEADVATSQFTHVGEQALNMLGYPAQAWYEPDFWSAHVHPDDRERAAAACLEFSNSRDNYELEYRMIAKDRRVVWLHNLVNVIRQDGRPVAIRGFSIDVTERKAKEAVLRDLSGRLINAQEEERRRVARELHDDLNQRMAMLSMELAQLGQSKKPFNLRRRLECLQNQAKEISADLHRISYRLHPSKLDQLGLAAAVRSLCQELSAKEKLKVEFLQSGFPADLPNEVTLCVFRIAQEALHNCVKHSSARTARVLLETSGERVSLSVSDDGCGFEMDSAAMKKGLGFTSVRERLRNVDGKLQIHSQPAQGTVIAISVPLTHEVERVRS